MPKSPSIRASLPSVDVLVRHAALRTSAEEHGRHAVVAATREELGALRLRLSQHGHVESQLDNDTIAQRVAARLQSAALETLRPVFNLTGVLIHTNLGRAVLPEEAVQAVSAAARSPTDLEFDLATGRRGNRDRHVESLLTQLTGAQGATAVNNNAAAVLLVLNTLAVKREVVLSRGELIEIGGEFRMPDVMKSAGCRLIEVGTTNRTHLHDYQDAIGARTALLMKVHPSNFMMQGFTKSVSERELAGLAAQHAIPLVSDLGAGTLVDFQRWDLPHETMPSKLIEAGVDLVTFSGDKLLGGPQAGIIVGRRDLIERINRNPLKRALRLDKLRIAALEAVLRLYQDPDRLGQRLPVLRHLTRPVAQIEQQALRLLPQLEPMLSGHATVRVIACHSEVGSGALPLKQLASHALAISPRGPQRQASGKVNAIAGAFRALPVPVIGRIKDNVFYLDLRCLEDDQAFARQLEHLPAQMLVSSRKSLVPGGTLGLQIQ